MEAREKILATAARLFARHGYESTSLSHVARDAEVSKALIFWHFESKERLFDEVIAQTIEPYRIVGGDIGNLDQMAPTEALVMLAERYTDFILQNLESVRFFLSLFLREEKMPDAFFAQVLDLYQHYRGLISDTIERGQRDGLFAEHFDARVRASLVVSALNGILVRGITGEEGDISAAQLGEELRTTLIDSLTRH